MHISNIGFIDSSETFGYQENAEPVSSLSPNEIDFTDTKSGTHLISVDFIGKLQPGRIAVDTGSIKETFTDGTRSKLSICAFNLYGFR